MCSIASYYGKLGLQTKGSARLACSIQVSVGGRGRPVHTVLIHVLRVRSGRLGLRVRVDLSRLQFPGVVRFIHILLLLGLVTADDSDQVLTPT